MDIMNLIDDRTLLIMPNNIKTTLLKNNKQLLNIKSLTKGYLVKKIFFDYDEQTVHYIMQKYHLKVDVALMYLDNMYYVDDINYKSNKLNMLVKIKQDLSDHNLLLLDNLFLSSLKGMKIIVYGYDYVDKFFKKMLDIIGKNAKIQIIENKDIKNSDLKIYEFSDIEDEINFVCYSICNLIKKGIDINNIKLGNISEDYYIPLKRIFSFYNIPLYLDNNMSLYGTNIVLSFLDLFKNNNSLNDSLDILSKEHNLTDPDNLNIYNKLVGVCNNYLWYEKDSDDIFDMLKADFKKTYISTPKMDKAVEVINLKNNIIEDDKYVFIMGFNQGSMPIVYKDEDYITDNLVSAIGLETTREKNANEHNICLDIVKRLFNVVITYKLKTKTSEYYPSILIDEIGAPVIKNPKTDLNVSYSKIQDELDLSKKLDKLIKYGELEDGTDTLYYNYQDLLYKTYNNSFKGIDNKTLINYLSPKLKLSYSSIDDYFKCAFKYYINSVMKFKSREETFYLTIGNLFHAVLSHAFSPNFDFDKCFDDALKTKVLSSKEEFFLLKLRDELIFIIKTINEHNKLSTFDKALYEEKIGVDIPKDIDVVFSGIVDKIMYKEDSTTLISLVDYKTGNADININNVIHGLNMQLPVYLYLIKNSHKFNNPTFVGFYLQEILHNEIYNDHTKDYESKKRDALKLKGYTLDEEDKIAQFDTSYADSRVIKGMKISSKGFYAYSKILNDKQINKLIDIVSDKIDEGATNILSGKFDINPKSLSGKNVACEYCDFRDLCYMKDSDIITLGESKDNVSLGGEDNE